MAKAKSVRQEVASDKNLARLKEENLRLTKKYKEAVRVLHKAERERDSVFSLKDTVHVHKIAPRVSNGGSEATAFLIASDWHVEEYVRPEAVNGYNEYNPDIAKKSAEAFFRNGLRLTQLEASATDIKTVVLALLGDAITNQIHEDNAENNALLPMEAVLFAQNLIASGIQYLLDNSEYDIVVPCHSGNHLRVTRRVHIASEHGHSLEYFMYHSLANHFRDNPRVRFLISDGYHSYLSVYEYTVRFHHGHHVRYNGGVGGLTIPMNKALAQWDQIKQADYSVCGHFHQLVDGGRFIVNGSLIGYNAYALSIKASPEPPRQTFFIIQKGKGRRGYKPIDVR